MSEIPIPEDLKREHHTLSEHIRKCPIDRIKPDWFIVRIVQLIERIARLEAEVAELKHMMDVNLAYTNRQLEALRQANVTTLKATQRAETAEARNVELTNTHNTHVLLVADLSRTLAEREKEIERLKRERFVTDDVCSMQAEECKSLRSRLAMAREALTRIASDFETDFVLDGVVVDEPYRMHQVAWEVSRAALAATDDKESK